MKIHLYAMRLDRPLTPEETEALTQILPRERRERLLRLPKPALREEPLCAYAALLHGLRQLYGWESFPPFCYAEYGKPAFAGCEDVHFSISHTRGAVLAGIHDHPVGVDIERIRPVSEGMMRRIGVSSPEEFFARWVRLESRGKRDGSGLAAMGASRESAVPGERLCMIETFPGYAACVCTHTQDETAPVEYMTLK